MEGGCYFGGGSRARSFTYAWNEIVPDQDHRGTNAVSYLAVLDTRHGRSSRHRWQR